MNNYQATDYIVSLNVTQFRAFKKALAVLMRAGITRDNAITILTSAGLEFRHRMVS